METKQALVARFMGLELREWKVRSTYCTDVHKAWFKGDVEITSWNGLKYDLSWNWFMEAYRKVKDILRDMERPSRNHCCKGDVLEVDIHCAVTEIDIKKAFEALVVFVEWYNSYQTTKQNEVV
jgi:hypothetical protein